MDNRAVIERIMKNLAFEVEAVPNNKASHADKTSSSKTDPLNVKIKVRKKEINGPISEPEIVLRKVCLENSAETIMSFDMFMETESEKKIARKPRKRLLKKLKPGLCLGLADDDDQPYTSDIVNSPAEPGADEPGGSSASKSDGTLKQPFNLAKNSYETFFTPAPRKHRTFLGKKCKPGGCLDPPFGEDKYAYTPSVQHSATHAPKRYTEEQRQVETNENTKLNTINIDKTKRKSKDLPLKIKSGDDKIKDSPSILNLYKVQSPRDSIITYPPVDINKEHKTRVDTKSNEDKKNSDAKLFRPSSIEKSRQSIDETSFFSPVKGIKKDSSYIQKDPLKRHSFNPKSIKKPVPISDSLNSVPLEQSNTGPSNIDIEPKVDIFHKQQLQSKSDLKDIEKIDVKPFIVPIHVDEEVTPLDGENNSLVSSKMEPLIEEDLERKPSIPTNYEPFITPIRIDEEVSAENINEIVPPIVAIKKHSTQSKNIRKFSNDNKNSESYQLLLKPTQSPQKVYETKKNEDYDDSKEIKPLFIKERKDTNRILSEHDQPIDLIEESNLDVEKTLSDKTEYLISETSNEGSDIISTDDQKSVSDSSVENETTQNKNNFREPSLESVNGTNINFDHKTRITEVLTEEPNEENESLNKFTKDNQSDKKSDIENQLSISQDQNLNVKANDLDPSNRRPNLENEILHSPKQSLNVDPTALVKANDLDSSNGRPNFQNEIRHSPKQSLNVDPTALDQSELKLNLDDKHSITPEHSLDLIIHQKQQTIVDSTELKPNLVDQYQNSQEQSSDKLNPSKLKPNLKDKDLNSYKESLDVNTESLNLSKPKLSMKDKGLNSREQSLDKNTKVLDPSEPKLNLKDKDPNSCEQSLDVNTEVLDPSEPKLNLKDSENTNSCQQSIDVNTEVLGPSEPKLKIESKDSFFHEQSLIISPKELDPLERQPNLKNDLMNFEHHTFDVDAKNTNSYIYKIDKNIIEGTMEPERINPSDNKIGKEPLIQTEFIIEQDVTMEEKKRKKEDTRIDERKNEIKLPKKPAQIPKNDQIIKNISTHKLPNKEVTPLKDHNNDNIPSHNNKIIVHESLDKGKVSPNKIKKESISPVDISAVCPDTYTLSSILSESTKNTVKSKEKSIPDINSTTDPRTVVLNFGFHSYINSKNERVIETVDGHKVNRYPKDSLSIIKSEIKLFENQKCPKLNVPIDSSFDLGIKINQNYNRVNVVPAKTRIQPVPEFPELAQPSANASGKMNCEQRICYEKILQNTLTDIYEQKLIPLRKVLRDLKSDIDKLAGQQTVFKKKVHGLEKYKQPRLNISNKKCGPCKH